MSGMSDKSAFESFERMQEKIENQERKAIAAAELQQEFEGDTLVQQFQSLEYHGSSDQQLLELKQKMGLLGAGGAQPARQIGKGEDVVHDAKVVDDDEKGACA
ncbi:MAG: PspA/IM30 family protein, partial [Gemmatimonadales bacterium]